MDNQIAESRGVTVGPIRRGLLVGTALAALLFQASVSTTAHAQQRPEFAAMCNTIAALDGRDSVRLGVVVQNTASGERCEVGADATFRSASLYKLVVLAEAHRQSNLGLFSFDDPLLVEPRHAIDDPPEVRPIAAYQLGSAEAIRRMIQSSANAEALALRDRLGINQVDSLPAALGMDSTILGAEFVTTATDIATYFALLADGELVHEEASAAMLTTLGGQLLRDLIPAALPEDTEVAHKTGLLDEYLHDAGIVSAPGGDFILVVMSQHPLNQTAASNLVREVAATAFEAFAEPIALGGLAAPAANLAAIDAEPVGSELGIVGQGPDQPADDAGAGQPPLADPVAATDVGSGTASEAPAGADSGLDLPGIGNVGGSEAALGGILLIGIAAVIGVFTYGFRLRRPQEAVYNRGAANAVAGGGERTLLMRLGIRKIEDEQAVEGDAVAEDMALVPASDSMAEVGPQPVMPSPRLERMAEFFASQQILLESIQQQYESEVRPLNDLLARQSFTQQRLLSNLENRLRPLNEYADGEEANLDALEQRMIEQGPDFIQRSFSEYLESQRQRIADTRDQIDNQRMPLLQYGEEQRDAVEVALSRFDADVEALELNLAEQRKLLMRMLDAMRSDSFVAVKGFLEARETAMAQLADTGITDPGQIGTSAQNLRDAVDGMASQSVHIQSVLEATDRADEQLVESAPGGGPYALPDLPSFDDALAELEAIEESEEAAAGA